MSKLGPASPDEEAPDAGAPDALIIGHYGFRNLGDEAILAGMLKLLRESHPEGRWMVVSGDPLDTRTRHGVAAVDHSDLPEVLATAHRAGVVIVGGGGLLSDQWGFRPQHVLSREAGDIPGYLGPALAAGMAGRRVLVWGVGVGPFLDTESPRWARALAEVASDFTVRTEEDRVELEKLGVGDAEVVADPAWLIDPGELPPDLNRRLSELPRPLVAVAPRSWGTASEQTRREEVIAGALERFMGEHGGSALLVPMQELGSDIFDDRRTCRRILDQLKSDRTIVTPAGLSPDQLITAFGRCELALNMRLHGTILATMGRTPSVTISYDPKVTRQAGELGLGRWCLPDGEASAARLFEALQEVWREHPGLSYFMYLRGESMRFNAGRVQASVRQALAAESQTTPSTEVQAIGREIILALTRNLSQTQGEMDEGRAENLELRNRIIRIEQAAQDQLQEAKQDLRQVQKELQAARDHQRFSEQRGDLLQLELDNLRQTRAMRLVTKYWRVRHKLRRKALSLDPGIRPLEPAGDARPEPPIPPLVTERIADSRGVVVFPLNIEWYIHLFQRPQQLAQAFARLGYTVIYDNSNQGERGWEEIEPRLFLYNGPAETLHHLPDPLVWALTYNWERAAAYPDGARTLYDWIDELDVFDGYDLRQLEKLHELALSQASITSASARSLLERATQKRPDTLYLPNGVEFERFADWQVSHPAHPTLQQLLGAGRPIAGYYGAIARWMDYDLLTEVAETRTDWSFLLIGPPYDRSARNRPLFSLPNVEWVPAQPYQDLPRWLQSFDVAMIPFLVNDITVSTSPLKLFEYFAGGKPVVSSRMPEVIAFSEVRPYRDAQGMSEALDLALADSKDPEIRNQLRRRGEENSWPARVRAVADLLEQQDQGE